MGGLEAIIKFFSAFSAISAVNKYKIRSDAFATSLAVLYNSSLLTGDPGFKILEKKENLSIG